MRSINQILYPLRQPLDRAAIVLMVVLSVLLGLLLVSGDRTAPQVRDFSWQGRQIGAEDTAFILTFNRPMEHASVEQNLRVDPPLPGKFSWAGRRMAYTLLAPTPYGTTYSLQLQGATERFYGEKRAGKGKLMRPFTGFFRSRDLAFVYIGVKGEEEGRLMLVNLTSSHSTPIPLTPQDLAVMDFKPYPNGDRILFSAADRASVKSGGVLAQELFTVTTGIHPHAPGEEAPQPQPAGKLDKILDAKDYQNLKFDLSADGKIIAVQRVNRQNPADYGPWILEAGKPLRPLQNEQGGDFMLRPDNQSMVISQKQGLAIVPLNPEAGTVEFLPKYEQVLGMAPDNSAAAYVKYNTDYTRSLFLVNNTGIEQEILRIPGSIFSVIFDPRRKGQSQRLYCLLAERMKTEEYKEQPFIAAIDLQQDNQGRLRGTIKPLLILPNQLDVQMSLSPDGLALLFDQSITTKSSENDAPRTDSGEAIANSRLWLLPLEESSTEGSQTKLKPEELPFAGYHPRWLP